MCQAYIDWITEGEARGIELGEKRGIELGEKRGIELGEKRGIERGETLMAELIRCLQRDKRTNDLIKCLDDKSYRPTLYKEYDIH